MFVFDVDEESLRIGGGEEEPITADPPDLGGLVPAEVPARLGDRGEDFPVGEIVHPRGRRVMVVENDSLIPVIEGIERFFAFPRSLHLLLLEQHLE